jgi:hypothetical protein
LIEEEVKAIAETKRLKEEEELRAKAAQEETARVLKAQ